MSPAPAALRVREIIGPDAIEELRPDWQALFERCPAATTFQRPEWLIAWIRAFAPHDPWIVDVRQDGRLVGLAPLFVYGLDADHIVAPIGAGISDYLDVLVDPAVCREVLEALFSVLAGAEHRWTTLDFPDLGAGSPLLSADLPTSWESDLVPHDACPVLSLPADARDLRGVVPPRQLARYRKACRELGRAGAVRVEIATERTLDELLDAFLDLHGARWRERGSVGALDDPTVQRFHRDVAPRLLAAGVLRLYGLRLDGRVIACLYGFFERTAAYFYLSGFDPALAWFSPGVQLVGRAIEDALAAGLTSFDFLRGREPYKYGWGARDVPTFRRHVRPRRPAIRDPRELTPLRTLTAPDEGSGL